ncbi:hypothetical protein AA103196_0148 [Ameyamaea chiangmaiensis NBRC 103196]|uniref:SIMPL domain-containing protein n=1 Tax=Ameyamaea chiangmaiensis TaxID=442969 RepID=A0A850PHZ4_9PROT|nr:SIMPL domain-containing protein [Ameyamaea chiangmaiensis]MBS4076422.1 SIMPL domain-containing protein [Ameyamaea chiangmaiensis]NVN41442.1 SIMPL domain-containing protein [Ameyamaea chiangmaiensis]GBQ61825.1 hypothetical protein AA103196_0148 [Ameyamaea chiangmaiensis NBRC 103196]
MTHRAHSRRPTRRHGLALPFSLVALLAVIAPPAAQAQPVGQPTDTTDTTTRLSIEARGSVTAAPDRLVATFAAERTAPAAAAAQRAVNTMIHGAVSTTAAFHDVTTTIGQYEMDHTGDPASTTWTARQTLTLNAATANTAAVFDLAGRLQTSGLALTGFDWQLADETRTRLQREASHRAIASLRDRADDIAQAMGLKVRHFATLSVSEDGYAPRPVMMMARMAKVDPQATAQDQTVSAVASATVVLAP